MIQVKCTVCCSYVECLDMEVNIFRLEQIKAYSNFNGKKENRSE